MDHLIIGWVPLVLTVTIGCEYAIITVYENLVTFYCYSKFNNKSNSRIALLGTTRVEHLTWTIQDKFLKSLRLMFIDSFSFYK